MMADSTKRAARNRCLGLETLEDRAVPASFGVPWGDPTHLTLSFVPDGTQIAGHVSSLFSTLNAQMPTAVWQQQILLAFQTWAAQANINIALVGDAGQPMGTPGPTQHDSRFGDIRVAAQQMGPESLSVSVPSDGALTGTLAGDVFVNSNDVFGPKLNLYAVALHEAGHVFGLPDSTDPNSPMYPKYTNALSLTPSDIADIQALYGVRTADRYEGSSGDGSINNSAQMPVPGGFDGSTPLLAYGDVTNTSDVDYFLAKPLSSYSGPMTVRLQSTGISLLAPRLSVYDAKGQLVGSAQASSGRGDTVSIHVAQVTPGANYYLRVEGATHNVLGTGAYALVVTFDGTLKTSNATIDSVVRGPYQMLNPNDIDVLFRNAGLPLFNNDQTSNDDPGVATQLVASTTLVKNTHYETIASISSPTDVDFYRVRAMDTSNNRTVVLTATVRAVAPNGSVPRIQLYDRDMNLVAAQILANGNGTYTVQAAGLKSGADYFIRVAPGSSAGQAVGNYALNVDFGLTAASPATFASGQLSQASAQKNETLYVAESQLFEFLLTAGPSATAGAGVKMTITDSAGKVVYTLAAAAGDTVSASAVFLTPGEYHVSFTAIGAIPGAPLSFLLAGDAVTDPIGPTVFDPTLKPVYTNPTTPNVFTYPGNITTTIPWLIVPKP